MQYRDRIQSSYAISDAEYTWLMELVHRLQVSTVLEFGPGRTTFAFLEEDCGIWSCEADPEWLKTYHEYFDEFPNVRLFGYDVTPDLEIPELSPTFFDLALIDGPLGDYFDFHSRLCSAEFARTRTNRMLFHDTYRWKECRTLEYMYDKGWKKIAEMPDSPSGFVLLERIPNWRVPIVASKAEYAGAARYGK